MGMPVPHACLCASAFQTARLRVCVCSRKETSDTSIMIENGGIREGPLFPRREGENESHAEKHGW